MISWKDTMERIKSLSPYQKVVLLLTVAMVIVFSVLYPMTLSQQGYEYRGAFLAVHEENGSTVYSGSIQGTQASFTVNKDKTVVFQYGDKTCGPYSCKEDSTAIPKDHQLSPYMTGVELWKGEEIFFRGGVYDQGSYYLLFHEDGSEVSAGIVVTTESAEVVDEYGSVVDPMEPSISNILHLMAGPELTHKGYFLGWLTGVFLSLVTAVSVLFAEELFRWHLFFRIRYPEKAEPSDWEIASRYITWTILPIGALIIFIMGLQ